MGDKLCPDQLARKAVGEYLRALTTDNRHVALCCCPHPNKSEVPIQVRRFEICSYQYHEANDGYYYDTMLGLAYSRDPDGPILTIHQA